MDIAVLGPLRVRTDRGPAEIAGAKERTVLCRLLAAHGRTVSVDELADLLWGERPPRSPGKSVQNYVLRLRKVLEPDRDGAPTYLLTDGSGYRLRLADDAVDAQRLERLVGLARRVAGEGRTEQAAATYAEAVALWRGEPYAGESAPYAVAERLRLCELQLTATEEHLTAELALGRARECIPRLEELVREHPLRERLWEQLVLALYQSGRQADALAAFARAREGLVSELGVEPGAALRRLQERILRQEPELDPRMPAPRLPAELVPGPGLFVGRGEELAVLRGAWQRARQEPTVVVVRGARGSGARRLVGEFAAEVAAEGHDVLLNTESTNGQGLWVYDTWDQPPARLSGLTVLLGRNGSPVPPGAAVIDLRPLTREDVRTILESYVATQVTEDLVADVLNRSGGRPALVHDMAVQVARQRVVARVETAAAAAAQGQRTLDAARNMLREGVGELEDVLDRAAARPAVSCPWKGLTAYDVDDAPLFAGRERVVAELLARLVTAPVLTLVGASGSGKSSLLRAGLVAALRSGLLPASETWSVLLLRPGAHPMTELARVALKDREPTEDQAADLLQRLVFGEPGGARTVLVVDQAEELFTLCQDTGERQAFLETVLGLAEHESRFSLVMAVRSDYTGELADTPELAAAMSGATVLVGSPSDAELRRAVELPAARAGLQLDVGLADALVADAGDRPGVLPLLSTALRELWDRRAGSRLTLAAYAEAGGVSGAVARLAERTYDGLDDSARAAVRTLMLRLAGAGDGQSVVRRRVLLTELAALPDAQVRRVVEPLADARLLAVDETHVEVAHEALFSHWPRLISWLTEDAERRAVRVRLATAAAEWEGNGREPADLWRGVRLAAATDLAVAHPDELTVVETEFVAEARARLDAERLEAEQRARQSQRQNRRLRRLLAGIALLLTAALVAGLVAVRARQDAEGQATLSRMRELANASVAALGTDPELAVLLAMEAVDVTRSRDGTVRPEAEEALHRAVTASRAVLTVTGIGGRVDWSPDGRLFVTEGPEESGLIDLRDPRTGRSVRTFRADSVDINMARFSGDGSLLASAGDDGTMKVWDVGTGERLLDLPGTGEVWAPAFGPDRTTVAGVWLDGEPVVRVWDLTSGDLVLEQPMNGVKWSMALTPDGAQLIAPLDDPAVPVLTNARTGEPVIRFKGHTQAVVDIDVSPDGRWVATSSPDRTARIWERRTGRLVHTIAHTTQVAASAWAPDSRRLATAARDGLVRLWDVTADAARPLFSLSGSGTQRGLYDVTFSPDGDFVMTGDEAVTATSVFDVTLGGDAEWATLPGNGDSQWGAAAFTPDGTVVSAGRNGALTAWEVDTGRMAAALPAPRGRGEDPTVRHLDVSGDGTLVVGTRGFPDSATVWDLAERRIVSDSRPAGGAATASWSKDGQSLVLSGDDGAARIVDRSGRVAAVLRVPPGRTVETPTFSPDGRKVAAVSAPEDRVNFRAERVVLWDVTTGEIVGTWAGLGPAGSLAYSPDGSLLAVGSEIGPARLVSTQSGETLHVLAGHTSAVTDVDFSADGERVATSSWDGTARLWDATTGAATLTLYGHQSTITSVDFSADGTRLVTAGLDDTVRVWALDLDDLLAMAQKAVTRALTADECRRYLRVDCAGDG
jgi:WD40 repeat protein/DNA-binding SARP family transcriptional activator